MRHVIFLAVLSALLSGCDSDASGGKTTESKPSNLDMTKLPTDTEDMNRLDRVMGTLLETWEQRYGFEHDLQQQKITFEVPGFTLTVVEQGDGDDVALLFEEEGTKHKAVCTADDAPKVIEALLFPEPEAE